MADKIIDVVIWIATQLKNNNMASIKLQTIALDKNKYTEKEISTAFCWMLEKLESKQPTELMMMQAFPTKAFRFFEDYEKDFFSKEAYGMIIQLLSIGLISNEHIEMMLERAEKYGFKNINTAMVKQFVAAFIFDVPPPDHVGSRVTLNWEDTIN